ncbi:MAG: hypothetical protein COW63_08630 [Bacteroidetes bacterium CG18_big_fil_WC_8_21_14_2_50_41_14]|nr:MAG: hypothetical protein COW63_08630 [Bacteroidetes bacterium CG18_big_fil_WC_8_21_14_2_50_41_14]
MRNKQSDNLENTELLMDHNPKRSKFNFYWVYGLLALVLIGLPFINWDSEAELVDKNELLKMLHQQDIEKIDLVNREKAEIYLKTDRLSKYHKEDRKKTISEYWRGSRPHYSYQIGSVDDFLEFVESAQESNLSHIYVNMVIQSNWRDVILNWIFQIFLLFIVGGFIMILITRANTRYKLKIFDIAASKAEIINKNDVTSEELLGVCTNCGNKYKINSVNFCKKCGNKV